MNAAGTTDGISSADWLTGIVAICGVLVTLYLGVRAAKSGARSARETNETSFMGVVMERLDKAEQRAERLAAEVDKVREQSQKDAKDQADRLTAIEGVLRDTTRVMHVALAYVERLLDFIAEHLPSKPDLPPIPPELTEHLPPTLLEDWRTAGEGKD